ncbi:MAG: hypothetical protein WC657_06640 [Candidatus Paceibacterota bacterium]
MDSPSRREELRKLFAALAFDPDVDEHARKDAARLLRELEGGTSDRIDEKSNQHATRGIEKDAGDT